MEHFALRILVEKVDGELIPTQAARELSEKYEEVMVDEYQDSNFVQELITTMVSGWVEKRKNIFMVGESSRASIASAWRGRSFLWKNTTAILWKTARSRGSTCTKTSEAGQRYLPR